MNTAADEKRVRSQEGQGTDVHAAQAQGARRTPEAGEILPDCGKPD